MERIKNFMETKLPLYIWGGLGSMCLAGVVFAGAWWHIVTAAICGVMFLAQVVENKREEAKDENL